MKIQFSNRDYTLMADEIQQLSAVYEGEVINYEYQVRDNVTLMMEIKVQRAGCMPNGWGHNGHDHMTITEATAKTLTITGWSIGHMENEALNMYHDFNPQKLIETFQS